VHLAGARSLILVIVAQGCLRGLPGARLLHILGGQKVWTLASVCHPSPGERFDGRFWLDKCRTTSTGLVDDVGFVFDIIIVIHDVGVAMSDILQIRLALMLLFIIKEHVLWLIKILTVLLINFLAVEH
jgi:hypothetical protein